MQQEMTRSEDTIDARELLRTIKQRKKLVLGITALFTLVAVLYAYVLAKPVYEVKAVIEIGKINAGTIDETPVDNINDVKQKLEHLYGVQSKNEREYPRVKSISVSRKSKNIFSVVVEGRDNQSVIKYIGEVVHKLEDVYAQKVKAYIDTQKELIALTENDIVTSQDNVKDIRATLKDYNTKMLHITEKDAALAGLYTIQISQNQARLQEIESRISGLKSKEFNLKLSIAPIRITETKIVGEVAVLDRPVKPKKTLIVVVVFIMGLMFSIFLVFFFRFLRGVRDDS